MSEDEDKSKDEEKIPEDFTTTRKAEHYETYEEAEHIIVFDSGAIGGEAGTGHKKRKKKKKSKRSKGIGKPRSPP